MKEFFQVTHRLTVFALALAGLTVHGFDYEGHRLINRLALNTLPREFPAFVHEPMITERIAFLSGEPDRLRNTTDNTLRHANKPEHYFDVEYLEPLGIGIDALPPFRYDFAILLGEARGRVGNRFPTVDESANRDRTRQQIGFLPWAIAERFSQLKSAFSYLKAYEENGTLDEIADARRNVAHYMGVLGHFVGDAAQPLHTTKHFNGWVGDNPGGYTTSRGFHSWIDGGYINRVGLGETDLVSRLRPARPLRNETLAVAEPGVFAESLAYVLVQHRQVIPLYELDKAGKLSPDRPQGHEGRAFFEQQYLVAAQMLGDLWFTAWKEAPTDTFLQSYLARRKLKQSKDGG